MVPDTPRARRRQRNTVPEVTPLIGFVPEAGVSGNGDGRERMKLADVLLGKRWTEIIVAVRNGEYTWAEFCDSLTEEELARGQLMDSNGAFTGKVPQLVPREFLLACQREQKRRFEELFSSEVLGITRQYLAMAQNGNVKDETRARMMQYAMERIFGPIPKEVRIAQAAPWESMVVNVIAEDGQDAMPEHLRRRYEGYAERQDDPSAIGE